MDERPCPWCCQTIKLSDQLPALLRGDLLLCPDCQNQIHLLEQYTIWHPDTESFPVSDRPEAHNHFCLSAENTDPLKEKSSVFCRRESPKKHSAFFRKRVKVRVVFENDAGFQSLYEQYACRRDVELAGVFLQLAGHEKPILKRYVCISTVPQDPGYGYSAHEPLQAMLAAAEIPLHFPVQSRAGKLSLPDMVSSLIHLEKKQTQKRRIFFPGRCSVWEKIPKYKMAAVMVSPPSYEDLQYNPVLQQADLIWILAGSKSVRYPRLHAFSASLCRLKQPRTDHKKPLSLE